MRPKQETGIQDKFDLHQATFAWDTEIQLRKVVNKHRSRPDQVKFIVTEQEGCASIEVKGDILQLCED